MRGSQTWAGAAVALTALAALLVPAAHASMYEDMFMDDLMKRLAAYDDSYMAPEWYDDTIPLESRDNGQTNIRDQEYLEHSASHQGGFQYIQGQYSTSEDSPVPYLTKCPIALRNITKIFPARVMEAARLIVEIVFGFASGGAGEGKQHLTPSGGQPNIQEIKSDDSLPFYCHPPNPCPKGYTGKQVARGGDFASYFPRVNKSHQLQCFAHMSIRTDEDGCQTLVEDTAESQKGWINGMMQRGMCTCDQEHMFTCPTDSPIMDNQKGQAEKSELDKMLNSILSDKVPRDVGGGERTTRFTFAEAPTTKQKHEPGQAERKRPTAVIRNLLVLFNVLS